MARFSFTGESSPIIDDKGRISVSGKFRDELRKSDKSEELVAYVSRTDGCLYLYPDEQWRQIEAAIDSQANPAVRKALSREYGLNSERLTLDKSGRLQLTAAHREIAGLEREVKMIGSLNKIEIWREDRLAACCQADEPLVAEALRDVSLPV